VNEMSEWLLITLKERQEKMYLRKKDIVKFIERNEVRLGEVVKKETYINYNAGGALVSLEILEGIEDIKKIMEEQEKEEYVEQTRNNRTFYRRTKRMAKNR
jgi:hypothetical protein